MIQYCLYYVQMRIYDKKPPSIERKASLITCCCYRCNFVYRFKIFSFSFTICFASQLFSFRVTCFSFVSELFRLRIFPFHDFSSS